MKKLLGYAFLVTAIVSMSSCTAEELPEAQQPQIESNSLDSEFSLVEPKK